MKKNHSTHRKASYILLSLLNLISTQHTRYYSSTNWAASAVMLSGARFGLCKQKWLDVGICTNAQSRRLL
jgi:hypothetical protein